MKYFVDLNSDIGEGFGVYKLGMDEEIIKHVMSINLACGWHAGDPIIMYNTVKLAKENNVMVGAHPSYPDLLGFGRRQMIISPEEAKCYILYQIGALKAFTDYYDVKLQHIKMHGAFYNKACNDKDMVESILDGIEHFDKDLIIMGLSGSLLTKEGKKRGFRVAEEVFADRGYNDDGTLVNRKLPGAFVKNPVDAIPRVVTMIKEGYVLSVNGNKVPVKADSICVHGDNPKAIDFVKDIRKGLIEEGIEITSLDKFIERV